MRVAAGALSEPGRDLFEELRDDRAIGDVSCDVAARGDSVRAAFRCVKAALGDRDDPFGERTQLLRSRNRRLDVLVLEKRRRLIAEHRDAVLGDAAKFAVCDSVSHRKALALLMRQCGSGAVWQ